MSQDSDIERVKATLQTQGIHYRSFGNKPVRAPLVVRDELPAMAEPATAPQNESAPLERPEPIFAVAAALAPPTLQDSTIVNMPLVDKIPFKAPQNEAYPVAAPAWVAPPVAAPTEPSFAYFANSVLPTGTPAGTVAGPSPLGQGPALLSRLRAVDPVAPPAPMPSLLAQMVGLAAPMPPLLAANLPPPMPMAPPLPAAAPAGPVPAGHPAIHQGAPLSAMLRGIGQGVPPLAPQTPPQPQSAQPGVLRSLRLLGQG